MISFNTVHKIYPPGQPALSNINFQINEGDFVFLAGASGAGKSTLLKLIYGGETPSKGNVTVSGRNLSSRYREDLAAHRREIGVIFQDYKLLPRRSVIDNVAFGLEVRGVSKKERLRFAALMLKAIGLDNRANASPMTLSGGEQQRVAIARALLHKPRIILADEPTGNLDPDMSKVVFDLLLEANACGVTVVVATHNLSVIEELNLRTIILEHGRVIGDFDKPGPVD